MEKILLLPLILMLLISCGEDEPPEMQGPTYEDVNVVTGLQLTDETGQLIGQWRQPNQKAGSLLLFPNPATDVVSVALPQNSSSPEEITNLWVIPADCVLDTTTADIALKSLSLAYLVAEVDSLSVISLSPPSPGIFQLDLTSLSSGFYKIFAEGNSGELFWVNLYRSSSSEPAILQFATLDAACQ